MNLLDNWEKEAFSIQEAVVPIPSPQTRGVVQKFPDRAALRVFLACFFETLDHAGEN
jgi:hypothetical protein